MKGMILIVSPEFKESEEGELILNFLKKHDYEVLIVENYDYAPEQIKFIKL